MLPPINIDISDILQEFSFSTEEKEQFANYILDRIEKECMNDWEKIVDKELKSTREAYRSGMSTERDGSKSVLFKLEGKGQSVIAIMLEEGATPFEQQQYFEKSSKRKNSKKGGWYLTIPFRLATSETLAESRVFSGQLTKPYQNLIKKHGTLTKQNVPKEMQIKGVRSEIKTKEKTYPAYEHKSFKFEGATRLKTPFRGGVYGMFRRVSNNSDPNAWIHPGLSARKFMDRVFEDTKVIRIFEEARDEFITNLVNNR